MRNSLFSIYDLFYIGQFFIQAVLRLGLLLLLNNYVEDNFQNQK